MLERGERKRKNEWEIGIREKDGWWTRRNNQPNITHLQNSTDNKGREKKKNKYLIPGKEIWKLSPKILAQGQNIPNNIYFLLPCTARNKSHQFPLFFSLKNPPQKTKHLADVNKFLFLEPFLLFKQQIFREKITSTPGTCSCISRVTCP